jgi:hypothetical protein
MTEMIGPMPPVLAGAAAAAAIFTIVSEPIKAARLKAAGRFQTCAGAVLCEVLTSGVSSSEGIHSLLFALFIFPIVSMTGGGFNRIFSTESYYISQNDYLLTYNYNFYI